MNSLRCSNCSFLNFTTESACKRCGLPFDSSAGVGWNPQPHALPESYPPVPEGGAYHWQQPSYHLGYVPPPVNVKSGASTAVKILIVLAAVALVSIVAIPRLFKHRRADMKNLSWTEYQSPDRKFSISLPVAPKITDRAIPTPIGNAQARIFEADVSKEGGCMLMHADYPVGQIDMSVDTLYDMALNGMATKRPDMLSLGARRNITLGGYRGIEVELKAKNSPVAMTGAARLFWVSPRLYIILVGGPDTPEFRAVHTRCFDSFRLSS
jgi:hypothetical protein